MPLQAKFCEQQQALLHGDLHTGSLMVTPTSTWMIDAEFACYGPMAFDVCKMIANLLLAYFASDGYASPSQPRIEQRTWLLQVGLASFPCQVLLLAACAQEQLAGLFCTFPASALLAGQLLFLALERGIAQKRCADLGCKVLRLHVVAQHCCLALGSASLLG